MIAICILIVGIYIIIKLIEFCMDHFPPPDPSPLPLPAVSNVTFSYFVVGAASVNAVFPAAHPNAETPATSPCDCGCYFALQVAFTNGLPFIVGGRRPDLISKSAFVADLAALGVTNQMQTVNGDPNVSYSGGVLRVAGGAPVAVTIESSFDLTNWTPAFQTVMPQDRTLDVTLPGQPCTNSAFYRVRAA